MALAFISKLGLPIPKTNVVVQKIDGLPLQTYEMAIIKFLVHNKLDRIWFFEENFLLTNISIEVVLEILFLSFNNANMQFGIRKLI